MTCRTLSASLRTFCLHSGWSLVMFTAQSCRPSAHRAAAGDVGSVADGCESRSRPFCSLLPVPVGDSSRSLVLVGTRTTPVVEFELAALSDIRPGGGPRPRFFSCSGSRHSLVKLFPMGRLYHESGNRLTNTATAVSPVRIAHAGLGHTPRQGLR